MGKNVRKPVAWVWQFPDGEYYEISHRDKDECERDCCGYDGMAVPLYTATPVPRDVLMAFGEAVRDAAKRADFDIGEDVNISAIADRYASQVPAEPAIPNGAMQFTGELHKIGMKWIEYAKAQFDTNDISVAVWSAMRDALDHHPEPVNQQLHGIAKQLRDAGATLPAPPAAGTKLYSKHAAKPDGWQMVPKDPTDAMLDAIKQVRLIEWCCDKDGNPTTVSECSARAIAEAMLSVSKKPEGV